MLDVQGWGMEEAPLPISARRQAHRRRRVMAGRESSSGLPPRYKQRAPSSRGNMQARGPLYSGLFLLEGSRLERRGESPPPGGGLVSIAPFQQRLRRGNTCETPAPKRFLDVTTALLVFTLGLPILALIG